MKETSEKEREWLLNVPLVCFVCVCVYVCVGGVKVLQYSCKTRKKQKIIRIAFVVNEHFLIVRTE